MIRKMAGESLPDAVIEQVYDRAGGVPLFVEEFTKMVREADRSQQAGQSDAGSRAWLRREIPTTLQDLVMARPRPHGGRSRRGAYRRDTRS